MRATSRHRHALFARAMQVPGLAVLALLLWCAGARAQRPAPAGVLSDIGIQKAAAYSARCAGLALLVVQNGHPVLERYAPGMDAATPHVLYSGTKAFWTVAAMAVAEDGLLILDEPVAATIPEWSGDPGKNKIDLRHLLDFTAGIDPGFSLHRNGIGDRNAIALGLPVVARPAGTAFIYGPSQLQVFGEVLRRKLARQGDTPWGYMERRVLGPLGLAGAKCRRDATGMPLLASGFEFTARQWLRFGLMVLHGGRPAGGGKTVVSSRSLAECFKGSSANPAFGMGFWLNHRAGSANAREIDIEAMLDKPWREQDWRGACLCEAAPPDLVACVGSGNQRLYVIPSRGLVAVRFGGAGKFRDSVFLRLLLGPPP